MSNPNDFPAVQYRLAEVILTRETFTADDLTVDGRFAIDPTHRPNSRQGVIGKGFSWAATLGLIGSVDTAPRTSRNPRRRRSAQRIWRRTDDGVAWAITFLTDNAAYAYVDPQLSLFDGVQ